MVVIVVARDVTIACLVPLLKTRGFSSLPVHFLGKAATFNLLYAFPLVLWAPVNRAGFSWPGCQVRRSRLAPLCTGTPQVLRRANRQSAPPCHHSTAVTPRSDRLAAGEGNTRSG